jgi:hypothetical protein
MTSSFCYRERQNRLACSSGSGSQRLWRAERTLRRQDGDIDVFIFQLDGGARQVLVIPPEGRNRQ